jgi:hypothetical protein
MAKVLVSFDDTLLRRIDRAAKSRGLSRSAYLSELAERDSDDSLGPGAKPGVKQALARMDALFEHSPAGDSTELLRRERDLR